MDLILSTLACPDWDLETLCRRASAVGFDGVDLRGLGPHLDVTRSPAFTRDLVASARRLRDAGLAVAGIGSSIKLCEPGAVDRYRDEAERTLALAAALGCERVRVFGGGDPTAESRETLARRGAETVAPLIDFDPASSVRWCLETHSSWAAGRDCRVMLDALDHPRFGAIWDIAHSVRLAAESPSVSLDALGRRLETVHIKDAIHQPEHADAMGDGWRYVLPGTGTMPLDRAVASLRERRFAGDLVFEHEKRWHPRLEPPEVALPAFVRWARQALSG